MPQIQLCTMSGKWASISTTGRLTLNCKLLKLPKHLGEFVIVHEIVHMLVPNHGAVFKSFMYAYLPDWQEREKKLQSFSEIPELGSQAAKKRLLSPRMDTSYNP